jgi:hypothetical protein
VIQTVDCGTARALLHSGTPYLLVLFSRQWLHLSSESSLFHARGSGEAVSAIRSGDSISSMAMSTKLAGS